MAKKKIKEIIEEIAFDFMTDNGLELYNVEFLKEGRDSDEEDEKPKKKKKGIHKHKDHYMDDDEPKKKKRKYKSDI